MVKNNFPISHLCLGNAEAQMKTRSQRIRLQTGKLFWTTSLMHVCVCVCVASGCWFQSGSRRPQSKYYKAVMNSVG